MTGKSKHAWRAIHALLVAQACIADFAAAQQRVPDKSLVYCSEASPAGFDDAQFTSSIEASAAGYTVYNRLVEFDRENGDIEPGLAQSWERSPDGLQYTFYLRHGVKFHTTGYFTPTREFNADDVVFTFERMRDAQHPFRRAYPVSFPYFRDLGLATNIERIDAPDPYTVRFTLARIDAPFLQKMAMPFASILSREYADKLLAAGRASDINWHPVGTGPFVFIDYAKDATIRFAGNTQYWKANVVRLKSLTFSITTDPMVRLQKLRQGECQVMSYPRPADIASIRKDARLQDVNQPGFNLGYLAYNTSRAPLDDVTVRRALDMSIDKHAILDAVYQGTARAATNPMPPMQWGYDFGIRDAPYDPARAKALLAQAGHANGLKLRLWAMPVQRAYNPNARLMAEMIQADWAKIGVQAEIVTYEMGEYVRRARAGEHDALLIGWSGNYGDPDDWLGVLLGCDAVKGGNFAKWCYKPYDDLIKEARATLDIDARTARYQQAQRIFKEQVPFTPIAHATVYQPVARNVMGFRIDRFGMTRFWGVGID
ncbi:MULTISPECIES: ABC transporter substrate-binding protein [Caballeronia]|uniref:ABC transporter substrate-binding protein n=1 Tax=Caballeronia TaxID=1827195 RepID=UPI00158DA471|nr:MULTISPECIES: ABC transporter substrate-binding protein [Caballeronia]MCG7400855.1 ABC transporter substrate-binding protein [Caballeronia zhejiangensis]MCI1043362.1 ABC transporter substrate-binding protein [Caballeronia zhejiangensis]